MLYIFTPKEIILHIIANGDHLEAQTNLENARDQSKGTKETQYQGWCMIN